MNPNKIIYVTDEVTLQKTIESIILKTLGRQGQSNVEIEDERMNINQAAKFADMSVPTFNKRIKEGTFNRHGSGRKIFFLKSELVEALKNS